MQESSPQLSTDSGSWLSECVAALPLALFQCRIEPGGRMKVCGMNAAAERLAGAETAQCLGRDLESVWPPARRASLDVPTGSAVLQSERQTLLSDEHSGRTYSVSLAPLDPPCVALCVLDVTESFGAHCGRQEIAYRTVLENTGTAVLIVEADMTVSLVNTDFVTLMGWSREEVEGREKWTRFFAPDVLGTMQEYHRLRRADPSLAPRTYESVAVDRHGNSKNVFLTVAVIPGTQKSVISMMDVTERRRLEKEVLDASERERAELGRDLHDGLGQTLTAAMLTAELLAGDIEAGRAPRPGEARQLVERIHEAVQQARQISRGLFPIHLERSGLRVALEKLVATAANYAKAECRFESDPAVEVRDIRLATQLYRVAQEALTNAIIHAEAKTITVALRLRNGTIVLSVRDDGRGLPENVSERQGWGMRTLTYRAAMMHGSLRIESAPGRGTEIVCSVSDVFPTASGAGVSTKENTS